ncbi:MAG: hypothetical protein KAY37_04885 [Phycisphaerae bacterium]|nr:hypothetical protein [Phycisphaerae bacterium]
MLIEPLRHPVLLVALALAAASAAGEPAKSQPRGSDLRQVKVATLYEHVTDIRFRSMDDMAALLTETHSDFIFRGIFRWWPCPESPDTTLPPQYPESYVADAAEQGYTYAQLTEGIAKTKEARPRSIFCGSIPAQHITQLVWNPITGEHFDQQQTWAMAADPSDWGIEMSKEEFQCEFAKTHLWFDPERPCSEYDPAEVISYYPDITNPDFQALLLSWVEKQIDCGADAIWIDALFSQTLFMDYLTGDPSHPAVTDAFCAASNVIDTIHQYGLSQDKYIYVGMWPNFVLFPYDPPDLDFVTQSPGAYEILDMTMNEAAWDYLIALLEAKLGELPPFFVFVDWASGDDTPLAVFSQVLDKQQQRDFLVIMDEFLASKGLNLAYPVHGGHMGEGASILSFGWSCLYDSLAPEFETYETIKELARQKWLPGGELIDDFDDGNDDGWTHFDTLEGTPWGPGIFDAGTGEYVLASGGVVPADELKVLVSVWDASSDPSYREGLLRATVRSETDCTNVNLMMRNTGDFEAGLFGYVFVADLAGGMGFYIMRTDGWAGGEHILGQLDPGEYPFALGEDWIMEGGAVGSRLSLKVWRVGGPEPDAPQLVVADDTYNDGQFSVIASSYWSTECHVCGAFDDIYFTPARPGDFDGDGDVDLADFVAFQRCFGTTPISPPCRPGDMNGDDAIDLEDFTLFAAELGELR